MRIIGSCVIAQYFGQFIDKKDVLCLSLFSEQNTQMTQFIRHLVNELPNTSNYYFDSISCSSKNISLNMAHCYVTIRYLYATFNTVNIFIRDIRQVFVTMKVGAILCIICLPYKCLINPNKNR